MWSACLLIYTRLCNFLQLNEERELRGLLQSCRIITGNDHFHSHSSYIRGISSCFYYPSLSLSLRSSPPSRRPFFPSYIFSFFFTSRKLHTVVRLGNLGLGGLTGPSPFSFHLYVCVCVGMHTRDVGFCNSTKKRAHEDTFYGNLLSFVPVSR